MRMAFGGMLAPWALIRADGAASMCYCPDLNSKQAGFNVFTGASGLGYSHYLRTVGAYVLPNKQAGNYIFGCHYEATDDRHIIRPWDGVGRRVILRQIGAEFEVSFGCFREIQLDLRKRWFETIIENPSDKSVVAEITIKGLWGSSIEIGGEIFPAENGVVKARFTLEAMSDSSLTGKVIE